MFARVKNRYKREKERERERWGGLPDQWGGKKNRTSSWDETKGGAKKSSRIRQKKKKKNSDRSNEAKSSCHERDNFSQWSLIQGVEKGFFPGGGKVHPWQRKKEREKKHTVFRKNLFRLSGGVSHAFSMEGEKTVRRPIVGGRRGGALGGMPAGYGEEGKPGWRREGSSHKKKNARPEKINKRVLVEEKSCNVAKKRVTRRKQKKKKQGSFARGGGGSGKKKLRPRGGKRNANRGARKGSFDEGGTKKGTHRAKREMSGKCNSRKKRSGTFLQKGPYFSKKKQKWGTGKKKLRRAGRGRR